MASIYRQYADFPARAIPRYGWLDLSRMGGDYLFPVSKLTAVSKISTYTLCDSHITTSITAISKRIEDI